MKEILIATAAILLGGESLSASTEPFYLGSRLDNTERLQFVFEDTPIEEFQPNFAGTNIATLDMSANLPLLKKLGLRMDLPFYIAPRDFTNTGGKTSWGDLNLGLNHYLELEGSTGVRTYSWVTALDFYAPTSRKPHGTLVGISNPTTDFYRYWRRAMTFVGSGGFQSTGEEFSYKVNVGYGFTYLSSTGDSDDQKYRHSLNFQMAETYHLLPVLALSMEENFIFLDKHTARISARGSGTSPLRGALSPSLSGEWEDITVAAFFTVPLDQTTGRTTNIALGLSAGYLF